MDKNKLFIGLGGIGKCRLPGIKPVIEPEEARFLVIDSSEDDKKTETETDQDVFLCLLKFMIQKLILIITMYMVLTDCNGGNS